MKKNILTIVCLLFAFYATAQQVRYVKQGGVGDGSSWVNASGDFQAMINASSSGDEVWVAEGTYQPAVGESFSMKEGVEIYGGFPSDNNSADMDDRNWNQHETILLGNGHSVIRNSFKSNSKMTSASVLDGFTITGNNVQISDKGAGIYNNYASPTFRNLIITRNRSSSNGGGVFNRNYSSPIFVNVLISDNRAPNAGGVLNEFSSPIFINTTIVNNVINVSGSGGGLFNAAYSVPKFFNSIVYGNNGKSNVSNSTGSSAEYNYSLVQGITTNDANGNIDGNTNPLFVDVASGNYRLSTGSPLINAGDDSLFDEDLIVDLDGNLRFFGGIDIGAYENQEVYLGPSTIYVKSNATGSNDGSSWADAYTDLQQAINNSLSQDQIWVAAGVYQPDTNQSFTMKEGVEIYGGFPNDNNNADMDDRDWSQYETILLGNGSRVISNSFTPSNPMTTASILDGFTITGNNVQISDMGAGIYNNYASPTFRNLIITRNRSSSNGGGVFNRNYSSPIFVNVLISDNRAPNAGGVLNEFSSPIFINTTIVNNVINVSGSGGGLFNAAYSVTKFFNSVVYGNNGKSNVSNSTGASVEYNYSLIQGITTNDANGNIDGSIDPMFINAASGDYRLSVISPLLDAGNNSLYDGDINNDFDLSGNLRLSGGAIDLGAFENHGCTDVAEWNGSSWSQAPNLSTHLLITGHFVLNTDLEGCSLTVDSGDMVVNSGNTVTLFNEVNVTGGTLTLRNRASLVQINDVNNTGEITIEKTTKPMDQSNYGYWSSPVEGYLMNEFSPLTSAPYYYSWDVNGQSWTQHLGGNQVMEEGQGYIIRAPSVLGPPQIYDLSFEGTPNNGDVTANVLGNGNFNFFGNPYPSAINIDLFLADADNSELDKIVYLWTNGYEVVNGNFVYQFEGFATYNAVGQVGNSPISQIPTAMIASGQGFFITGNANGTAVFKNSHRVVGNNNNLFNKLKNKHRFWVNLESDKGYFGQTLVGYMDDASNGKDKDIDAALLESSQARIQVYSLLDEEKVIIQGRALPFDTEDSFPLGYIVKEAGTYAITLGNYEGLFAEEQDIFLKDNLLNAIHNLKEGKYEFITEEGTFDNRFEIVYKKSSQEETSSFLIDDSWVVYNKDGQLHINSVLDMKKVSVFDMLGRLVYEAENIYSQSHTISEIHNQQVLIVKVSFENNHNSTKKIKN
ncbi:MAG: choice-of-anchor Q domain-containing protein [Flavobacteriaceae bacterium]